MTEKYLLGENMIIYEVNIELNPDIVNEFDEWLDEHIEQMLQFEGFSSAKKLNSIEDEQYFLTVHISRYASPLVPMPLPNNLDSP